MELILLIDFGSTYTKAAVVDLAAEELKATAQAHTTVNTNIMDGLNAALLPIQQQLGKDLNFSQKIACSSAAGGLKMVAMGLVKDLTAEAAKRAALGAGARVLEVFSHELSTAELERLNYLNPDIILLAGGTDGGNREVLLTNAQKLSQLKKRIPVVVAGNKVVAGEAADLLNHQGFEAAVVDNVMPELNQLNIEPARLKIREIFLTKIIEAKGLKQVEDFIDGILMPTPAAVLGAAKLLAEGTAEEPGWGDLIVMDPGGATTDVHSVAEGDPTKAGVTWKGLPEPKVKRTVEGDLGLRYSAQALLEAGGMHLKGLDVNQREALGQYVSHLDTSPDYLPTSPAEAELENALASLAVEIAMERHAGYLDVIYTPFGASYLQYGKDLTGVKHVIGTGGVLIHNAKAKDILAKALFQPTTPQLLKPQSPTFWLDQQYILAAMGLLAEIDEVKSLRILKKYMVNLGRV